jgi:hypothetical protein
VNGRRKGALKRQGAGSEQGFMPAKPRPSSLRFPRRDLLRWTGVAALGVSGATATVVTSGGGAGIDLRNPANAANYANRRFHLFNNRSDVLLGMVNQVVAINNDFGAGSAETARLAFRRNGAWTVLDAGPPSPGTRLLTY